MSRNAFLILSSGLAMSAGLLFPANYAQAAPAPAAVDASAASDAAPAEGGDIVVTGSRIARDGATSPTPVTVLGNSYLQARASTNIADSLNELPSFRGSATPAASATSATNAGANYVDLRGLGSNRTLLLVDGKRHVPTTVTGRVDLNLIPSILIDRVEVVTGGASAVYGSDAVAGVVNLIYKRNFQGLEGSAQYLGSQRGDAQGYNVELHAGQSFLDDRLHVSLAGQAFSQGGIENAYNRAWGRKEYYLLTNPTPSNGLPTRIITSGVHNSTMTKYGLITSGPLRGTQFDAAGNPFAFQYGSLVGTQYMVGGDGYGQNFLADFWMQPKVERQLASAQVDFDATDNLKLGSEFYFGRAYAYTQTKAPFDFGTLTIQRDNAYLPASIRAAMDRQGLTSFGYGRFSLDIPPNTAKNITKTYRFVETAQGHFGDWKWDAYYQFGRVDYLGRFLGVRNKANYLNAIDSVINPATGQPACRSTLTNPTNGCVPYNPFGDQASQNAKAYVTGDQFFHQLSKQHVAAANLSGEPVDLWAGPLAVSVGAEYRYESAHATSDALGQANAYAAGNYKPIRGAFHVTEGYVEAQLPVLKDAPLAKSVELNGAVRYADYSISGGATTWKGGLVWEMTDGLRLRATRSRDVRAPNISEFFSAAVTANGSVTDPFSGNTTVIVPTLTSGNRNLRPEKADTFTVGASYVPAWARGIRLAVDYYDIKIRDAIASLTAQNIVDRCFAGDQSLCGSLVRTGGVLTQINVSQLNIAKLTTRGVDLELSYAHRLFGGELTWRNLATYVAKYDLSNGSVVTRLAGQYNGLGVPHWSGNSIVSYNKDRATATVVGRFLGAAKYDNQFVEGRDINDNSVSSRFYVDLTLQYDVWKAASGPGKIEAFVVVNNLFDKDPSIAPQTTSETNPAYFDVVGRAFRVGARFRL